MAEPTPVVKYGEESGKDEVAGGLPVMVEEERRRSLLGRWRRDAEGG